jgi:hypothetical protein
LEAAFRSCRAAAEPSASLYVCQPAGTTGGRTLNLASEYVI